MSIGLVLEGKLGEALPYSQAAIELAPEFADAYINFGKLFQDAGDVLRSIEMYKKCLALQPFNLTASDNMLFCSNCARKGEGRPTDRRRTDGVLSMNEVSDLHIEWGRRVTERLEATGKVRSLGPGRTKVSDRIVIGAAPGLGLALTHPGFIGPDMCYHSVSYFFEAVLRHLNKSRFKTVWCATGGQQLRVLTWCQLLVSLPRG